MCEREKTGSFPSEQLVPLICHLETWLTGNVCLQAGQTCASTAVPILLSPCWQGANLSLSQLLWDLLDTVRRCYGLGRRCTTPISAAGSRDPLVKPAVKRLKCVHWSRPGKRLVHMWEGMVGRQGLVQLWFLALPWLPFGAGGVHVGCPSLCPGLDIQKDDIN